MSTPTVGSISAHGADVYAEYKALLALAAENGVTISDHDDYRFCEDGPGDAAPRLRLHLLTKGVRFEAPKPEPVDKAELQRQLAEHNARIAEAEAAAPKTKKATAPAAALGTEKKTTRKPSGKRPGPVNAPATYNLNGGYFKVTNGVADELLADMPGPVLKGYVYATRLARGDGTFWLSSNTLAKKIGCKSVRHGWRVLDRLQTAGLIRLLSRGGPSNVPGRPNSANTYQIVAFEDLDAQAVRQTLRQPLSPHRGSGPRDQ
jgi:hypothetical protein